MPQYDEYYTREKIREIRRELLNKIYAGDLDEITADNIEASLAKHGAIAEKYDKISGGPLESYQGRNWASVDQEKVLETLLEELEGVTPANRHFRVEASWQGRDAPSRRGRGTSAVLAVVINPKLKIPILVGYDANAAAIYIPRSYIEHMDEDFGTLPAEKERASGVIWARIGDGHIDEDDAAASATGWPRTHTPSGVWPRGQGMGTCLYTALVVLAKMEDDQEGVSTAPDHSHSAGVWWRAAVKRGLAQEDSSEREIYQEDMADSVSHHFLAEALDGVERVDEVHELVISGAATGGNFLTYSYEAATEAQLVAMTISNADEIDWSDTQAGLTGVTWRDTDDVNVEAIAALNVEGYPREFVIMLAKLALEEDPDNEDIRLMLIRHAFDTDPESMGGKQSELDFRGNPGRRIGDLWLHPNPEAADPDLHDVDDEEIELALDRAEELREELGWYDLEDLP